MAKTTYVVFSSHPDRGQFMEVGRYEAGSATAAISKHKATLDKLGDGEKRVLAATPSRSWLVIEEVGYVETKTRSTVVSGTAVPDGQLTVEDALEVPA